MPEYHPKIAQTLTCFDAEEIPTSVTEHLPLLDRFRRRHSSPGAFEGVDALFVQHHLGPTVARFSAMFEDGLKPDRCWIVDIPYSTNRDVYKHLRTLGCPASQAAPIFENPLAPYSESQEERVLDVVRDLAGRRSPRPLLVVDDGAYFARALNALSGREPRLLKAFSGARVVEQTTRGHRYLHQHARDVIRECGLACVSIARCFTKKSFESPFIGAAVSRAISRALGRREGLLSALNRIGVIGFGSVGQATVLELLRRTTAQIDIVDVDERARLRAASVDARCRGLGELDQNTHYGLVVGCTGYGAFRLDQRQLLDDGAYLASGSSAAVEFNREGFIELADARTDDEIKVVERERTLAEGIHATISLRHEGAKVFYFLNAGFPVNFDGRMECLPARIIQPTHCLLYAASIQSLSSHACGIGSVNQAWDRWIFEEAVETL